MKNKFAVPRPANINVIN